MMIGGVVASQKGNCIYGRDRQSQMFLSRLSSQVERGIIETKDSERKERGGGGKEKESILIIDRGKRSAVRCQHNNHTACGKASLT